MLLGSGCFWGREYYLRQLPGVITTQVGFAGGHTSAPSYQQVCYGNTGHAEVVRVVYDVRTLTTEALLRTFFCLHDFTKDRSRHKAQYRSIIIFDASHPLATAQEKTAIAMLKRLRDHGYPPSTTLQRGGAFYAAESRHQQYCSSRGIVPKKREAAKIKEILTNLIYPNI